MAAIGGGSGILSSGLFGWWLLKSIVSPIVGLTQTMLTLERGDEAADAPLLKRRDEIGELAEVVQAFKASAAEKKRLDTEADALRGAAESEAERSAQALRRAIGEERAMVVASIGAALAKLADKDLTYRMTPDLPDAYRTLQTDFNKAEKSAEGAD